LKLVKTSLLNAIAVFVKMVVLFGINKALAIFVGPSGYALLGQFQNIVQIVATFSSGAINTGVTKYTAEYADDPDKQKRLWSTAGTISVIGAFFSMLIIIFFKKELAVWLLHDENLDTVFIFFAIGLVFFVLNTLLLAILNGKAEIRLYVMANLLGSLISFLITVALTASQGLWGALVALSIFQSGAFFSTVYLCRKAAWFRVSYLFGRLDTEITKNLFKYTMMASTSALCFPVSNILVRDHLIDIFGNVSAGYWEAMTRLSGASMLLFSSVLSVYYLPKYSALKGGATIKKEVFHGYKIILPAVMFCCIAIYLLRDFIIMLLFSSEFLPMRDLFFWYQVGDFLKMGSWILAFIMIGKAMVKIFIVSELVFTATYVGLTFIFTEHYGLIGSAMSYALNYLLYWIVLYFVIRKNVFKSGVY